jgi:UDP-glucose 4-epimerase
MSTSTANNEHHAGPRPRVLVTGGAGFIGSHVVDEILKRSPRAHVTVVDSLSTGRRSNLEQAIEQAGSGGGELRFIESRVEQALPALESEQPFDRIYHFAAAVGVRRVVSDPISCIETNVDATASLLRFAARRAKPPTLIASSSEVYGKSSHSPFCEDDDCLYGPTTAPRWSYATSKAIDEYLAIAHHHQSGVPTVIVRLFNTVGPRQVGDYGMVIPRFVGAAMDSRPIEVFGDGSQTRCFCDVRDIAPALVDLLEATTNPDAGAVGRVFNLGSDQPISIAELAGLVKRQLSSDSPIRTVPFEKAMGEGFEDLAQRRPSLSRVRSVIGFEPKIPLARTVRDVADALRFERSEAGAGQP